MTEILNGTKAIVYLTERGKALAEKILQFFPDFKLYKLNRANISQIWSSHRTIIFIMATGIAVRSIAPLIKDKKTDPAVLVIDEQGKHIIPLIGGHLQGANEMAKTLAKILNGVAVITTASDLNELPALDLWIKRWGFKVKNPSLLPKIMSKLIGTGKLKLFKENSVQIPLMDCFQLTENPSEADIIITNKAYKTNSLILIPKNLFIGIGFHDWITQEEIENSIKEVLSKEGLLFEAVTAVATIDKKANHNALISFCNKYGLKLYGFCPSELNKVKSISHSETVCKAVGVSSVCEQACIMASQGRLIVSKQIFKNITVAVSESKFTGKGKLYVVGTGPGRINSTTPMAVSALRNSELIVGYRNYIEHIKPLIEDKEVLSYSMTDEIKRAKRAIEEVLNGKIVSLISGGDPGVYGMAGVVLEILSKNKIDIDVEIIPGISALNACSARAGAPIMNDFAVISLSDRLTPWSIIEKRLEMSAKADFVIVIYNPKSMGRQAHLTKAKEIILKHRAKNTPVAIVKGATRENESVILTTVEKMDEHPVDMQTTVIVGNSKTFVYNNWLITPRGYEAKYEEEYKLSSSSLG